jgi:hypothetical protein
MRAFNGCYLMIFLAAAALAGQDQGACFSSAPDGYRGKACTVTVDRDNPASPATLIVHGHTTVTIHLKDAHGNETVTFTPTTTKVAPADVAGTFFKNAVTPLQSLVMSLKEEQGGSIGTDIAKFRKLLATVSPPTIATQLNDVLGQVEAVLTSMSTTSAELACLEGYKVYQEPACTLMTIASGAYTMAKSRTVTDLVTAAKSVLPVDTLLDIEANIAADVKASDGMPVDTDAKIQARTAALQYDDLYTSIDKLAESVIGDIQMNQKAMLENAEQLGATVASPDTADFSIKQAGNYNSVVTIVTQEVMTKTPTTIATVTINWVSNPWEVSTGIMFSALKDQSFSNADLVKNGQSVLDPTTQKNLTVVQNTYTRPAVIFPMVMANARLGFLSNARWENACPNHCAFLLSGGIGLNLNQKDAEFAVGPSFQIGEIILGPVAHIGRYTDLTQGIGVGDQLGVSPPSPLPTATRWTAKLGFAVTYVLPWQ